jgi:hypothetical protein
MVSRRMAMVVVPAKSGLIWGTRDLIVVRQEAEIVSRHLYKNPAVGGIFIQFIMHN